jgi:rhamnosyltransferase subunit B
LHFCSRLDKPLYAIASLREVANFLVSLFGSLGDLFPYLALGEELLRRGHRLTFAAPDVYEPKILASGFEFAAIPPSFSDPQKTDEMLQGVFHPTRGSEFLFKKVLMPAVEEQYERLLPLARKADVILNHPVSYATPIIAEKLAKPWISTALQPILFLSRFDQPVPRADLEWLTACPPAVRSAAFAIGKFQTRFWVKAVDRLRKRLGLPTGMHPVFEGMHSPHLGLAMFSQHFAPAGPDWPTSYRQTGFPFYDQAFEPNQRQQQSMDRLKAFLDSGPAPIVFTLGSSAVMRAGDFYSQSWKAARAVGRRAVLLTGPKPDAVPKGLENGPVDDAIAVEYAPHSLVFPHACINVHPGGVGTLSQAMRAGKPMLVVPYSQDQPDNAARIRRLGLGLSVPAAKFSADAATPLLQRMLSEPNFAAATQQKGVLIRQENGVTAAADAVGELISGRKDKL